MRTLTRQFLPGYSQARLAALGMGHNANLTAFRAQFVNF
jgi:hypothetical protein